MIYSLSRFILSCFTLSVWKQWHVQTKSSESVHVLVRVNRLTFEPQRTTEPLWRIWQRFTSHTMFADYNGNALWLSSICAEWCWEKTERWICLTVMTDSVVLRSSDLARLRGGRVEWWKSKPWAGSIFCSWMCERNRRRFTLWDVLVCRMQVRQHHYCLLDGCKQVKQSTREALICRYLKVNK